MVEFCPNSENRQKLLFLTSNDGKAEFDIQIQGRMKGLLDIIEEYQIKIPLENLIILASLIQPRLYTIASSSNHSPKSIHLCVAMQIDQLPDGNRKVGLASSYFMRLRDSFKSGRKTRVKIAVRESSFILPTQKMTSVNEYYMFKKF